MERLQKIMARAGIGSRRHNEELIRTGRVEVNGKRAELGMKVDPEQDKIVVDGEPLPKLEKQMYIMVNKPRNVISDEDDQGRKTVRDMIDVDGHLYPVGRLDKQSIGLVLMTNDGNMAHHLTHPRFQHEKIYRVKVGGLIDNDSLFRWRKGVYLDDGKTLPASVKVLERENNETWLEVTMREGRKRQIRRVASLLGYPVTHLARVQLGPLKLGELGLGKWRHLTWREVEKLRRYVASGEKRYQQKVRRRMDAGDKRPSKSRPSSNKNRKNPGNPRKKGGYRTR